MRTFLRRNLLKKGCRFQTAFGPDQNVLISYTKKPGGGEEGGKEKPKSKKSVRCRGGKRPKTAYQDVSCI